MAFIQPGQMDSEPTVVQGRYGRRGNKWFSFDVPVDASAPMILIVTYTNNESLLEYPGHPGEGGAKKMRL